MSPRRPGLLALGAALLVLGSFGPTAVGASPTHPDDPVYGQGLQWGLARIGAPDAWARGRGEGITIAVVDSGVDLRHQDLRDRLVGEISCIGAAGDPTRCRGGAQDDNGHGTHVAGIALASTDNDVGVASVAPGANLLAVRVLADRCDAGGCRPAGSASDVAAGIRWAADHGADIINLSVGGGALQSTLGCAFCDAVDYAWSKGAIPVVAAGNDAVLPSGFADEPAVIVTATTRTDARASYSNTSSGLLRQARWPVAAPGGEAEAEAADCRSGGEPAGIVSTYWVAGRADEYACLAGTSMAAPHVSGALALLRGLGLGPQEAVERLLATAADLGAPGRDGVFGYGRIDLAAATAGFPAAPAAAASPATTSATVAPEPSVTAGAVTTTVPGSSSTTEEPPLTVPGIEAAAPFEPAPDPGGDAGGTSGGLPWGIGAAMAVAGAAGFSLVLASRRAR